MPDRQFSDLRLAKLYDLGNAGSDDRDFYIALAGERPIRILDLGCGTGLLCHAYARAGHAVVGVDPAAAMLDVAKHGEWGDTIEWIEARAEEVALPHQYDLIVMTGHAFQVLLSDDQVRGTLNVMAAHLKPDGRVVFESRNPGLDWDEIWARSYTMDTADGLVRAERRITDASRRPEFLSFAWDYHFPEETVTSDSTLRFLDREEIVDAAGRSGLELVDLFGDWDGSAFAPQESKEMIFVFRKRGTAPAPLT